MEQLESIKLDYTTQLGLLGQEDSSFSNQLISHFLFTFTQLILPTPSTASPSSPQPSETALQPTLPTFSTIYNHSTCSGPVFGRAKTCTTPEKRSKSGQIEPLSPLPPKFHLQAWPLSIYSNFKLLQNRPYGRASRTPPTATMWHKWPPLLQIQETSQT